MLNGRKSYSHTFICVAATLLLIFGYSNCVFAEGKAGELRGPSTSAGTHGVQTSADGKQVEPKVTKPGQNESQAAAGATTTTTSNETRSSETPVPADGPKTVNSVTGTVSKSTQSSSVNQTAANNETEAISNSTQSSNVNQKTGNIETRVSNSTQTTNINRTTGNNETTVSNSTQTSNINQTTGNNETTVSNSTQTSNINQTTGNNGTTVSNSTQTSNINQTTGNNETTVSNSTQTSNVNHTTGNNETTVSNSTQTINVNHTTGNNETTVSNSTQSSSVNQTTGNNETATVSNSTQSSNTNQTADTAAQDSPAEPSHVLSIFLVNDLQYDIFPVNNESGSVCYTDPEAKNCVGGLPSLKKFMDDRANLSNKIWLNAGNTLGGDLFRTLKFNAAVQAMKLLNFSAMAVGPSVFKYGDDAGKMYLDGLNQSIVVSNIDSVQQRKSVTLTVGTCNVSVIGYLENTELDKDIPGVKNATQSVLDEITRIRNDQKNVSNLITVVIGSSSVNKSKILALNETVDFVFFSGANWSEEADKSKGKLDIPQFFYESVNKSSNKTAYVASLRVNHSDVAGRFIVGLIELPIANSCRVANANFTVQDYRTNTTNNAALDLIKLQLEVLQRQNKSLTLNNNNLTAERDLCINSECSLGNLITDAMVAALNYYGTWSENVTRIGIFPAVHLKQNTTIPEGNLTVMNLTGLLDQDAYIYSVLLTGRQLKDILEVSINSSSNSNSTDFLHVSRLLQIEYRKDRSNKSEIISVRTVSAMSSSMKLSEVDVNNNASFYNVSVPFMLFRMDSYKKLLMSAVKQYFHSVTIVEAVTKYISNTGALFLPVIGSRFIRSNLMPPTPPPPPPPSHCADHTGTTVAVTLVVAALIVGLIFGVWRWRSIRSHLLPGYVNF